MNEQQLADLFSEQLDRMLEGEDVSIPDEAMDLQELLSFGQQFSQLEFQPTPAAQAAFTGQVATWFNAGQGMTAGAGIPKILLVGAVVMATALGLGGASYLLSTDVDTSPANTVVPAQPVATSENQDPANDSAPVEGAEDEIDEPLDNRPATAPRPAVTSSKGDQIELKPTSSLGDVVPLAPSLEPTTTITTTPDMPAVDGQDPAATGGENGGGGSSTAPDQAPADDSEVGQSTGDGDQDRGHGNDPDGVDEDNPGNSSGVGGGNDGNNSSLNPSDFGQGKSGGASGGSASGGGQGNSSNGKGKSDDKGNKGGNGKGKKD